MKKTRSGKRRTTCPRSPQPMSLPLHDSCPFRCAPGPHAHTPGNTFLIQPRVGGFQISEKFVSLDFGAFTVPPGIICEARGSVHVDVFLRWLIPSDSRSHLWSLNNRSTPPPKIPLRGRAYLLPATSLASDCFLCSSCLPLASCCHFRDYSPSHFKRHKWRALRGGPALGAWVGRTGSDG